MTMRVHTFFQVKYLAYGLIVAGLLLAGVATLVVPKNHAIPKAPPASQSSDRMPSATKPDPETVATYTVAPTLPKFLTIDSIGVKQARILQLGLNKKGEIATPNNIYDTGWYDASAKPGQPGAMFIYGHVSSWQAKGVFYNLKKLRAGDKIMVTKGDNSVLTYEVVSTKEYAYDNVDMQAVLSPIDPDVSGLNLMTCAGKVIKGTSEFDKRLVVFTKLVR